MATSAKIETQITEPKPRLVKLIVQNFRCIGSDAIEIELDDIVVLVGANNSGKSTILRAYQIATSEGSKEAELQLDDFPNKKIDPLHLPTIEIHTIFVKKPTGVKVAEKWLSDTATGEKLLRERWIWEAEGKPKRQGWDVIKSEWSDEGVPSGAAGFAKSRLPEPHYVDAFASPEIQAKEIVKLIKKELTDRVKNHESNPDEESDYKKLIKAIGKLQAGIVEDATSEISKINTDLTMLIQQVFPGHKIDFEAKPEDNLAVSFFKADPQLLMGVEDGHMATIDKQGSGARRTLLWTVIKFAAENTRKSGKASDERPHILLLDEPEICLHPNAIRDACNALYALPQNGSWQVMITTHSPTFIDFSKDNTTVVRVNRTQEGDISTTTVYRPKSMSLDEDDRQNLKLLNICDPYVAEFFFGGRVIIVEGDTEYTAFRYVISQDVEQFHDVHILRARGKATIVSLVKLLNHFGSNYSILHDSDKQRLENGNANSAWTNNQNIIDAVNTKPDTSIARLLASVPNFEEAYFGTAYAKEKPYKALRTIMENKTKFDEIKKLLKVLLDKGENLPNGCLEWTDIKELAKDKRTQS